MGREAESPLSWRKFSYDLLFLIVAVTAFYALYLLPVATGPFSMIKHYADRPAQSESIEFPHRDRSEPAVRGYTVSGVMRSRVDQVVRARFRFDDEIVGITLNDRPVSLEPIKREYGTTRLTDFRQGYVLPLQLRPGENSIAVAAVDHGRLRLFQIARILEWSAFARLLLFAAALGLLTCGFLYDKHKPRRLDLYFAASVGGTLILLFSLIRTNPLILDELYHYIQITMIRDEHRLYPVVTPLPGYHLVIYGLAELTHSRGLPALRLISMCVGLLSVPVFFLLARVTAPGEARIRALHYLFLPTLFPLWFLLYTDSLALLLILLSAYLLVSGRFHLAAWIALASVFVRQSNILWLGFVGAYILWERYPVRPTLRLLPRILKDQAVVIFGGLSFLLFVILNKGVALGVKGAHPAFEIHFGNFYFLLFSFFFLFLPLNLWNAPRILALLRNHAILVSSVCTLVFAMFFFTFTVDYPFHGNFLLLRNNLLHFFMKTGALRAIFGLVIVYSLLSIAVSPLRRKELTLLYPFAILFLIPWWIVEPRFQLVPLVLFQAFRRESPRWVEISTLMVFLVLSLVIFFGYQSNALIL